MKKHFFLAGTDTDVGKTLIASALLNKAQQTGLSTLGLKPIAAGAENTQQGLRNQDALMLQQQSTVQLSYEQVNPVCLEPAIAPHIAAEQAGKILSSSRLTGFVRGALMNPVDFAIVEGAGGWRVPLNSRETLADVVRELQLPVILVIGMKLGCLNHTLLTIEAIQRDGLPLAGWVANCITEDMPVLQQNIETLHKIVPAPCLGVVAFQSELDMEAITAELSLPS